MENIQYGAAQITTQLILETLRLILQLNTATFQDSDHSVGTIMFAVTWLCIQIILDLRYFFNMKSTHSFGS